MQGQQLQTDANLEDHAGGSQGGKKIHYQKGKIKI